MRYFRQMIITEKSIIFSVLFISLIFFMTGVCFSKKVSKLSVKEAINMALKQNLDLQIAQLNLNKARVNYQKKKVNNLLRESRYIKLKNKLSRAQAKNNYRQTRNQIISEIVQQYLELISLQTDIQKKEKKAELEKRKLKDIKVQVKNGDKRHVDLVEQQNEYHTAIFQLEKAKDDYEQLWLKFKSNLGITREKEWSLQKINQPSIWELTQEMAIQGAIKNNFALKAKEWQLKLAGIDLERAKIAANSKLDIENLKYEKKLAKLNYKKVRQNLKNKVKKRYCIFQQAIKNLKLSQRYLVQVRKNHDIIRQRQRAGLKSRNNLLSAKISLLEARYNYQSAIKDYYVQQMKLQQTMGLQLGVSLNDLVQTK